MPSPTDSLDDAPVPALQAGQTAVPNEHNGAGYARVVRPELLDTLPAGDPQAIRSRRDLRILNHVLGNRDWFGQMLERHGAADQRILEIGAGGGELSRRLLDEGFQVDALDLCPPPSDWPASSRWHQGDVLSFQGWADYPVVISNLFLHHLTSEQLRALSLRMAPHVSLMIASEPARRRRFRYLLLLICYACFASPVTRHDGCVSIDAGFSGDELQRGLGLAPADWLVESRVCGRGSYRFLARRRP